MINLPNVTLIAVDTAYHDLTRMAIEDSCKGIKFAKTIIFTDKSDAFDVDEVVKVEAKNNIEAEQILWYKVPEYIATSHVLVVQWDGWVINPHLWDDNWLEYDYIGAPWSYKDGLDIGNGGFSLRSRKLMKFLAEHSNFQYLAPEDNTICRKYRRELEARGFKWPNKRTAEHFSFEWLPTKSFGFHGYRSWPLVLIKDDFELRSHHVSNEFKANSYEMACIIYNSKLLIESGLGFGFLKDNV